jgi:hypothetical protein
MLRLFALTLCVLFTLPAQAQSGSLEKLDQKNGWRALKLGDECGARVEPLSSSEQCQRSVRKRVPEDPESHKTIAGKEDLQISGIEVVCSYGLIEKIRVTMKPYPSAAEKLLSAFQQGYGPPSITTKANFWDSTWLWESERVRLQLSSVQSGSTGATTFHFGARGERYAKLVKNRQTKCVQGRPNEARDILQDM